VKRRGTAFVAALLELNCAHRTMLLVGFRSGLPLQVARKRTKEQRAKRWRTTIAGGEEDSQPLMKESPPMTVEVPGGGIEAVVKTPLMGRRKGVNNRWFFWSGKCITFVVL
jgi:hypothetical protein